jgi:hypothetical protein
VLGVERAQIPVLDPLNVFDVTHLDIATQRWAGRQPCPRVRLTGPSKRSAGAGEALTTVDGEESMAKRLRGAPKISWQNAVRDGRCGVSVTPMSHGGLSWSAS